MGINTEKAMEDYIHISKYARWRDAESRRETWEETVARYIEYFKSLNLNVGAEVYENLRYAILHKDVMPSMRALMTAGKALDRCNTVGYNCAGIAVDNPRVFDEHFYLLMGGSGVGFSVERQYINKMPDVAEEFYHTDTSIVVKDSRTGWAKALKELIALLYNGEIPKIDISHVRAAGEKLKTMGGRASGPAPLVKLFNYLIKLFSAAKGRKLNSAECHKVMCKIAETVIVGSVRRSACISFGNLTDDRHRRLKTGEFWVTEPELVLSNNSVMYTEKPDLESFTKELRNIYKSKAGERGIVNQEALRNKATSCGREHEGSYLLNPCAEAILRDSGGLCNLSEVIIRPKDTLEDLKHKVKLATIIGTLQSTLTNFKYLRKVWRDNAEEERLLGVSFTGIMDHHIMSGSDKDTLTSWLITLKQEALDTNKVLAEALGINRSKQITLVKPSGTVSQLCSTSSGIHPRYAHHYVRRVTQDNKDPLTQLMIDEGIPYVASGEKTLFSFPIKSPEHSVVDISTLEQLEIWKIYRDHWCDGNPSQTVYYTDDTFLDLQSWVWKHWDSIGGLSFFPKDDNVYDNNPYEPIDESTYDAMRSSFPSINWSRITKYEQEDTSVLEVGAACSGGQCEL